MAVTQQSQQSPAQAKHLSLWGDVSVEVVLTLEKGQLMDLQENWITTVGLQ